MSIKLVVEIDHSCEKIQFSEKKKKFSYKIFIFFSHNGRILAMLACIKELCIIGQNRSTCCFFFNM